MNNCEKCTAGEHKSNIFHNLFFLKGKIEGQERELKRKLKRELKREFKRERKREGLKRELKSNLNKAFKGQSSRKSEPCPLGACFFSDLLLFIFKSKQAGLLMYTKEFEKFVLVVEWQALTTPHFSLGKHTLLPLRSYYLIFYFKHIFFLASEVEYQS